MGLICRSFNDFDKAIECYLEEIKGATRADGSFGKQATIAFNNLGVVYKKQLQIDKAIDAFKVAISMNPNYFEAYTSIAGCFFEDMNLNIKYFARAFRIRPDEQLWNHIVHSYSQAYRISPQTYFDKIQEESQKVDISQKVAFDLDAFMRLKLPL
jgi:tetratricopeptide (TPR) repeat protein